MATGALPVNPSENSRFSHRRQCRDQAGVSWVFPHLGSLSKLLPGLPAVAYIMVVRHHVRDSVTGFCNKNLHNTIVHMFVVIYLGIFQLAGYSPPVLSEVPLSACGAANNVQKSKY